VIILQREASEMEDREWTIIW